jgi:hypothetical protein
MTHRTTTLLALPIVVLLGALSLSVAAPASAAPLPDGATISVVLADSGQVYNADPTTADLTPVGVANPGAESVSGLDANDTGAGWAVSAEGLYSADLVTGVLTFVAPVTGLDDPGQLLDCESLDLSPTGDLVASCEGIQSSVTGTINTTTGAFTTLVDEAPLFDGLATNPLDGVLYGLTIGGAVYKVDLAGNTATLVGQISGTNAIYDADFDRAGQLWLTSEAGGVGEGSVFHLDSLFTVDPATWTGASVGIFTTPVTGPGFRITDSISVWGTTTPTPAPVPETPVAPAAVPAPMLAESGLDVIPLGLAGGLALMLGLGAVALRRRSVTR